jgi:DNA-binding NarL/FixJ family response regulator
VALHHAAELAQSGPDPLSLMLPAMGAMFVGDDRRAVDLLTRGVELARTTCAVAMLPTLLAPLATVEAWTSRFTAATANAGEGLRLATEIGQDNPAAHARSVLAWVAAVQGRDQECAQLAESALSHAIGQRLGPHAAIASWALAVLDLGRGRPEAAADRLEAMSRAAPGEGHRMVSLFAAADLVEAASRAGRADTAAAGLTGLRNWAGHVDSVWARALVARCTGVLSSPDEAEPHFEEALVLHSAGGRPFDTARTALLYGEHLRRRRRRTQARTHLRSAHETFARLGAAPWADKARAELEATGETARKRDVNTADTLTPQELQIARFVAQGATNRAIAARLFLSPRTVDYHLHKVFTKLGLTSRAELMRMMIEDGGQDPAT